MNGLVKTVKEVRELAVGDDFEESKSELEWKENLREKSLSEYEFLICEINQNFKSLFTSIIFICRYKPLDNYMTEINNHDSIKSI